MSEERFLDPADAFALLGDETRLEIVTGLYDASLSTPARFSTLYEQISIDDTAQFNYHLGELVPHFVAKRDEGYELTERGKRIARVITAELYTGETAAGPFDVDGACYACDATALEATYEDERFQVECRECGEAVPSAPVPPGIVRGHDPDDVGAAVDRWAWSQVNLASSGICPTCGGGVDPLVVEDVAYTLAFDAVAAFECDVCTRRTTMTFGALATGQPVVEQFYQRRGGSIRDRRFWEIEQYVADDKVHVVSADPWRVRTSFHANGDACHVEIDETLEIVRTEVVAGSEES